MYYTPLSRQRHPTFPVCAVLTMTRRRSTPAPKARPQPLTNASHQEILTLHGLVEKARALSEKGMEQREVLEWLCRTVEPHGIRVRRDGHWSAAEAALAAAAAPAAVEAPPAEAPPAEAPAAPADPSGGVPAEKAALAIRRKSRETKRADNKNKKKTVPVILRRGKITIKFSDPALQEHDAETAPANREGYVGRVILSGRGRQSANMSQLRAEANGAVIDARRWRLLAVPPRAFALRPPEKRVNEGLAGGGNDNRTGWYEVVEASDGTIVTLYAWEHPRKGRVWCISSTNGYDVSHLKWMGRKTYAEILHEALGRHEAFARETKMALKRGHLCEGDVRLDFEGLDPAACYTVGFRHENFHPLTSDPPAVWNVQTTRLAGACRLNEPRASKTGPEGFLSFGQAQGTPNDRPETLYGHGGLPHVPRQKVFTRAELVELANQSGRKGTGADGAPITLADLNHITRTALQDAKDSTSPGKGQEPQDKRGAPPNAEEKGQTRRSPFNYGYVLRSRAPAATREVSDVLVESPLLQVVRRLAYGSIPGEARADVDETNHLEFNLLKAYLNAASREDAVALFTGARGTFARYEALLKAVRARIIVLHRAQIMGHDAPAPSSAKRAQKIAALAVHLLRLILEHEPEIDFSKEVGRSILDDYVTTPFYALIYLKALEAGEE